ncbi:hypothetical protein CGCFRS4_v006218 [Colletotrichum fructicola]|nr:hypothetical protein CGCFRS4_v006218 [Colletotrichum fructicola]
MLVVLCRLVPFSDARKASRRSSGFVIVYVEGTSAECEISFWMCLLILYGVAVHVDEIDPSAARSK